MAVWALGALLFRWGLAKTLSPGSSRFQGRYGGNRSIESGPYFNVGVAVVVCRSCTSCSVTAVQIGRKWQCATVKVFLTVLGSIRYRAADAGIAIAHLIIYITKKITTQ